MTVPRAWSRSSARLPAVEGVSGASRGTQQEPPGSTPSWQGGRVGGSFFVPGFQMSGSSNATIAAGSGAFPARMARSSAKAWRTAIPIAMAWYWASARAVADTSIFGDFMAPDRTGEPVCASTPRGARAWASDVGSRYPVHVVIPDITRRHWVVNIRKFLPRYRSLDDLVAAGSVTAADADLLAIAMREGRSILVSGATHAGKTTLLAALIAACAPSQRIVTVEETFELAVEAADLVALQGRQPSLEGGGEVTLRRLVKEALRMRPDRLVIGEVRDVEALDLVLALNTGVPGAATIHANSAADALRKLCSLPLLAGRNIDSGFVVPAVAASVDLVVHCQRDATGRRRVTEIVEPTVIEDGIIQTRPAARRERQSLMRSRDR